MNKNQKESLVLIAIGFIPTIIMGLAHLDITRQERKRRKIIKAGREMIDCGKSIEQRLTDMLNDPATTDEEFMKALREENAFLNIVQNMPKY
jgi:hypothetical protein